VPRLLGARARLLERIDGRNVKLEPTRTLEGPGVTHLKYRVAKAEPADCALQTRRRSTRPSDGSLRHQ